MGTVDKAAIGWSIGIVLVAVGIAALGPASEQAAQPTAAPAGSATMQDTAADNMMEEAMMEETMMMGDSMADDAMEEAMMMEETVMMDDTMTDEIMDDVVTSGDAMTQGSAESGIVQILIPEGTGIPGCEADDTCFDPFSAVINAGDTVVWTNEDSVAHMVNAGDLKVDSSSIGFDYPNGFDSGLMMSGDTFEWTFDDPGDYPYLCQLHPWMVATIQVN